MTEPLVTAITIFVLAILLGFEVISKVPATLHNPLSQALSLVAVAFATMNVVGGYLVTDRMLAMFRKRPAPPKADAERRGD
jgi:NAD(P) transhydrogenase subunit alpha